MPKYVTNFDVKVGNTTENVLVRDADLYPKSLTDILLNPENAVYTVGANAMYTTINAALTVAQADGKNSVILILPGTYNENIDLRPANSINLYGLGEVIVQSNQPYPYGPLYVMGKFRAYNIRFVATDVTSPGAYAFHHEQANLNNSGEQYFVNCEFVSYGASAVGLGIGDASIFFENCRFTTIEEGTPSFYCHNASTGNGKAGNLIVRNCWGENFRVDDAATHQSLSNTLSLIMLNNSFIRISYYDYTQTLSYIPDGQVIRLSNYSSGNNAPALNYDTRNSSVVTFNCKVNSGDILPHHLLIPFADADKFTWELAYSSVSLDNPEITTPGKVIQIYTATALTQGIWTTMTLRGTPK